MSWPNLEKINHLSNIYLGVWVLGSASVKALGKEKLPS